MALPSSKIIEVSNFDGNYIYYDKCPLIEIGNFLGGGAAGTVYECEYIKTKDRYALKILNPLGYKLMTPALLRKCNVLTKGKSVTDDNDPSLSKSHVWWLLNNSTKQYISAFYNEKTNSLKELSLSQCVNVWTADPSEANTIDDENPSTNLELLLLPTGQRIYIPKLPPKFIEFIRKRSRIFREINNMRKISNHPNVIRLEGVLELVQDTKCTIFLVMELANGGELFDRIKVDCGTREETAKFFFQQLLDGVKHCHNQGVCHRDLKPEVRGCLMC
jgi:serine/threonine protein kinase